METGAYGMYPRYTQNGGLKRRRYNVGRYLRRKYLTRGLRQRPINQFTYPKTRVGKYTKTQLVSTKCTYQTKVILENLSTAYQFATTNQFLNMNTILAGSPEFASRVTQYSYFMINGMQCKFTRRWVDPITTGAGQAFNSITEGLSMLSVNFYPNLASQTVGQSVENADSSWKVSPFIQGVQSHYQPFPKNFTTGSNSYGLGVWNAANGYTNISGELAIYNDPGASAGTLNVAIWDVEINVYAAFCNNTGA